MPAEFNGKREDSAYHGTCGIQRKAAKKQQTSKISFSNIYIFNKTHQDTEVMVLIQRHFIFIYRTRAELL